MRKVVGWLISHDLNQGEEKVFELVEGKNIIGKKTTFSSPHIAIDDKYVSKRHAVIIVKLNQFNVYEYYIADNAEVNDGKPSTNGTYINGKPERISDPVRIIDGDTIQVGRTKLVLKTADINANVKEAIKLVKRQEQVSEVDFEQAKRKGKKNG